MARPAPFSEALEGLAEVGKLCVDKAHCVTLGVGEGEFQPSPCGPVSRRAVADFCFLPALCSSGDSGLSLSAPRLPRLTWPGLEELPVRAGCDDLPTAIVKSRVHRERMPCPALPCPPSGSTTLRLGALAQHLLPSASVVATSPWSLF